MMQNLKRNWLVVSKLIWGIWQFYTRAIIKICILMGSFWTNYIMFELKTYRGVMFHGTEEWHKIWRKTDMWFGKLYKKFRKFYQSTRKTQIRILMGSSYPKQKMNMLTEKLCIWQQIMIKKMKRNWLVVSKLIWRMWQIFARALGSFKNLLFNRIFLNKVYNVWAKQVEGSYVSWHWRVMQNDLWCGKWHEEFGKFLPQRS